LHPWLLLLVFILVLVHEFMRNFEKRVIFFLNFTAASLRHLELVKFCDVALADNLEAAQLTFKFLAQFS